MITFFVTYTLFFVHKFGIFAKMHYLCSIFDT
jgi:hypothetical protein